MGKISRQELNTELNEELNKINVLTQDVGVIDTNLTNLQTEVTEHLAEKIQYVTYASFGVNGDKKYYNPSDKKYYLDAGFTQIYNIDDGIKIKECHEYANANNLPVINVSGEYVIKETRNIPVLTNVDFGQSVFHIDESVTPATDGQVFHVKSVNQQTTVTDTTTLSEVLPYLKRGTNYIPVLSDYKGYLCFAIDEVSPNIGKRNGTEAGQPMEDFFYISDGGKIIGEIGWTFSNLTKLEFVKCDENHLIIKGGTFLLSGNLTADITGTVQYKKNGFYITRSRVNISNQNVRLESEIDTSTSASDGFYYPYKAYDVQLNNVEVTPRKYFAINGINLGTYAIGGKRVLDLTFNNVRSNGGTEYWGAMGTNFIKNLIVQNSNISRIDVHFYCWNATIENTDTKAITLMGGGKLICDNVNVFSLVFLEFRGDYGATWDGDIIIKGNSKLIVDDTVVDDTPSPKIVSFRPTAGDFGYPVKFGRKILMDGFTLDFNTSTNTSDAFILDFTNERLFSNERPYFPDHVHAKDVSVEGRAKGVQFSYVTKPNNATTYKTASFSTDKDINIEHNALWVFENVQTTKTIIDSQSVGGAHLTFVSTGTDVYDANSFVPKIVVKNCDQISLQLQASLNYTRVENCTIYAFDAWDGGGRTKVIFTNCDFKPDFSNGTTTAFFINATYTNSTVVNCTFYPFKINGVINYAKTIDGTLAFFGDNANGLYVRANHVGTKLSPDIIDYISSNSTHAVSLQNFLQLLSASTQYGRTGNEIIYAV